MMIYPRRAGGFLIVKDVQGHRHAIRLGAVSAICDADEDGAETVITLYGGRNAVKVAHSFEAVTDEILEPAPRPTPSSHG
ncbi:MAG: hypothetical protein H7Z12_15940 [Rhodospirillaceae bacterium]|nr:hypothetical protein [Rhodospirillales bacterium]